MKNEYFDHQVKFLWIVNRLWFRCRHLPQPSTFGKVLVWRPRRLISVLLWIATHLIKSYLKFFLCKMSWQKTTSRASLSVTSENHIKVARLILCRCILLIGSWVALEPVLQQCHWNQCRSVIKWPPSLPMWYQGDSPCTLLFILPIRDFTKKQNSASYRVVLKVRLSE